MNCSCMFFCSFLISIIRRYLRFILSVYSTCVFSSNTYIFIYCILAHRTTTYLLDIILKNKYIYYHYQKIFIKFHLKLNANYHLECYRLPSILHLMQCTYVTTICIYHDVKFTNYLFKNLVLYR